MTLRGVRVLCVLGWLLAAGALGVQPLQAHAGGHPLPPGTALHLWTDPATHEVVPGTLLFVARGEARVEDVAGHTHAWAMAALTPADRALADAFRARVEARHGLPPAIAPQAPGSPIVWVGAWLALFSAGSLGRAWRRQRRVSRLPVAALLAALPLACGGGQSASSAATTSPTSSSTSATTTTTSGASTVAGYFSSFPAHVRTRQDGQNLYVESDGLPDHTMMVGIRSWQQQVPLPAAYTGANAWTIPLSPRLADTPVSARTGLFRGAIALAVNGVPIFNALNNRGDDAFLFGELDDFGGHAGRADDYHYHTAPLFLSTTVGATKPIAVALDGFALYGSLEPDGSALRALDDYNGHADGAGSYHYHGTRTYPYINGGMKGVVTVSDQVEPQPSVTPVRPAGTPLTGAVITKHAAVGTNSWALEYTVSGRTFRVDYRIEGTRVLFVFTDPTGVSRTETYNR